jgi:hypothetical protein
MSNLIVDENTRCLGKIMRSPVSATPSVQAATSLAEARVFLRDRPSWVHCLDLQLHEAHRTEIPTPSTHISRRGSWRDRSKAAWCERLLGLLVRISRYALVSRSVSSQVLGVPPLPHYKPPKRGRS